MKLSVIVPTHDGDGLQRLFDSIHDQIDGDEILVVGDTHRPQHDHEAIRSMVMLNGFRYEPFDAGHHCWGHCQINYGMDIAKGEFFVFIDDEDVFTQGAFMSIKNAIMENGQVPYMFRFHLAKARRNEVLWKTKEIQGCMVGGHNIVTPNIPGKFGKWACHYEGDFNFISSTLELWPQGSLVWRDEIISVAR